MVGLMAQVSEVEANCAICGAPPVPECPHEGDRLKLALDQATERWAGMTAIREWVLNHARNQVINTFHHLRAIRMQQHANYLESLPCYKLYHRFNGAPPMEPGQLQVIHAQIAQANAILQAGVDQDWRTSCQRYPEVLDYYFNLIEFSFPPDSDPMIRDPRFGAGAGAAAGGLAGGRKDIGGARAARPKPARRDSSVELLVREHRKKDRRRSRGRTPPPQVPMAASYRRH